VGQHKRQAAALEAADWFVRFDDRCTSRHDRARYLVWLKQSPVHVAETLRLMRIHQSLRSIVFPPTDACEEGVSPGSLVDWNHAAGHRRH
jgi:ferric-dicitrate binding protein FerR (iron transport regulator)